MVMYAWRILAPPFISPGTWFWPIIVRAEDGGPATGFRPATAG